MEADTKNASTIVASPRTKFNTLFYGAIGLLFGGTMIIAGVTEPSLWLTLAGIPVALLSLALFFRYQQLIVDAEKGVYIEKTKGIFRTRLNERPLQEITGFGVKQGIDTNNHKYWHLYLIRDNGSYVDWHTYTYLGKAGMEQDVAKLETALGCKPELTSDD